MKISETWLREWVNPALTRAELGARLTMAGLEIEEWLPLAEEFKQVVVAEILEIEKHPEADRLHICRVQVGQSEPLTIVCGASHLKVGMKVPAALEGAVLPNNLAIKISKIRGVTSYGMLCTASELGLAETSDGLMELPQDATLGENIWDYFQLADHLIDVSITPNRGDCLSVKGLAQEIAALTQCPINAVSCAEVTATVTDALKVDVAVPEACPRYVGRILKNVKADAETPLWLKERLRRSGIRSIHPIVDVTNYVMLELGQPMHAFDLRHIDSSIHVRMAKAGEPIHLLDGSQVTLDSKTLVIADAKKILAIAGVMGGMDSGVSLLTKDIFLESAFFQTATVTRQSRHYNLTSESAYRFERGIDPLLQRDALERATQLLLEIVGGEPGPVVEIMDQTNLPQPKTISLSQEKIKKILGMIIAADASENILKRLGFTVKNNSSGWDVTVPAKRSDLKLSVDLIEEIARVYGYEHLPLHDLFAAMRVPQKTENKLALRTLRQTLCDLGYHEVITYSFIDPKLQTLFDPSVKAKELVNPMTSEMAVMRTSLWPGLLNALLYNQNRQMSRIRLFESGLRFILQGEQLLQQPRLAGLITGNVMSEQWGLASRSADFFDLKGDLQHLFTYCAAEAEFVFEKTTHPVLHPEQTALIKRNGQAIGILGLLHPSVQKTLDVHENTYLFEIDLELIQSKRLPRYIEISKYPEIRRDLAILIDRTVPWLAIRDTIIEVASELLKDVNLFDVYQGKGIPEGRKSVALALTLQHSSRTLVDKEVNDLIDNVIIVLKQRFKAELRG